MPMDEDARRVWENWFNSRTVTEGRDECGAAIRKGAHGQGGKFGWEIDHIVPESRGGSSRLDNLQPLHWKNNDAKSDSVDGKWRCAKTS